MGLYGLALGILGVWRVSTLLNAEDGPAGVMVRFRSFFGSGPVGQALDCFYCLSLWVAIPFALGLCRDWGERVVFWLAISGGAIILERVTAPAPAAAAYRED